VTILDAYALIALLADEPAAADVEVLLGEGDVGISSVNLAESLDVSRRTYGVSAHQVRSDLDPLVAQGQLAVVPATESIARRAASVRGAHYRRRSLELSLADCFLLATAASGDRIATADPGVAEVAGKLGVDIAPLPDSLGHRP